MIIFGCFSIINHKKMALNIKISQNRLWGFHFSERVVKFQEYIILISGIMLVVFGILAILKILE